MLDVVELTQRLVAVDSQNHGPGEAEIADLITSDIAVEMGLEVLAHELHPGRPNLVLSHGDDDGPHLVLAAHLDTKPIGDSRSQWNTDPFELTIIGDNAYGLGATDMKGAVAAMLIALQRHRTKGLPGRLSVLLTADEEQGSDAGAKALSEAGLIEADAMVIGEPSGVDHSWEMLALVSRGICCFTVTIRTQQGHSGLSPRYGRNAVLVAADVLRAFEDFEAPVARPGEIPASPTVNPGLFIDGGVSFGTWPGQCTLSGEIRLVPGMDEAQVKNAIADLVMGAIGDEAEAQIDYVDGSLGWMPAVELSPSAGVVAAAQQGCRQVLGSELPLAAYPGGTDATYFMGVGAIPTVTSLGPGLLSVAHGPNEYVPVADLHAAVQLYETLTESFLTQSAGR